MSVSSVTQSCLTLCKHMDCRMPGSLSITNSQSLSKLTSIKLVMPSNHLILCRPLLPQLSIFPSIRVFSNESVLCIKWPEYRSFSFSIVPSKEIPGLILLQNGLVGSPCSPRDSQQSSPTPQLFGAQPSSWSNSHVHT